MSMRPIDGSLFRYVEENGKIECDWVISYELWGDYIVVHLSAQDAMQLSCANQCLRDLITKPSPSLDRFWEQRFVDRYGGLPYNFPDFMCRFQQYVYFSSGGSLEGQIARNYKNKTCNRQLMPFDSMGCACALVPGSRYDYITRENGIITVVDRFRGSLKNLDCSRPTERLRLHRLWEIPYSSRGGYLLYAGYLGSNNEAVLQRIDPATGRSLAEARMPFICDIVTCDKALFVNDSYTIKEYDFETLQYKGVLRDQEPNTRWSQIVVNQLTGHVTCAICNDNGQLQYMEAITLFDIEVCNLPCFQNVPKECMLVGENHFGFLGRAEIWGFTTIFPEWPQCSVLQWHVPYPEGTLVGLNGDYLLLHGEGYEEIVDLRIAVQKESSKEVLPSGDSRSVLRGYSLSETQDCSRKWKTMGLALRKTGILRIVAERPTETEQQDPNWNPYNEKRAFALEWRDFLPKS